MAVISILFSGIGLMKRKMATSIKPEIIITIEGNKFKIETITSLRTNLVEFELEIPYQSGNLGGEREAKMMISTLEGDTLVTKEAESGKIRVKREFSETGFTMIMFGDKINATRVFKRIS